MDDKRLYELTQRVAAMAFEYNTSSPRLVLVGDSRNSEPYSGEGQTKQGLFVEQYYCGLRGIWTPWGLWPCWNGGAGIFPIELFIKRLGGKIHREVVRNDMGEFGPIFRITKVEGVPLPEPIERDRKEYLPYDQAIALWKSLSK